MTDIRSLITGWVDGPANLTGMKGYPYVCQIQVRWRDLDAFAHVNNATFASYLEMARTKVFSDLFGGREAMEVPFFVTRLEIDYRRPVKLYDEVRVGVRVGWIKGASFTFEYLVEANGEKAAEAITTLACVENTTGRVVRLDPGLRKVLASLQVG
jgi:acyl-CoA thioester hydrolase